MPPGQGEQYNTKQTLLPLMELLRNCKQIVGRIMLGYLMTGKQ